MTHNKAASEGASSYYEMLGLPGDSTFDDALKARAEQYIKPEFAANFLNTFQHQNVLAAYSRGITNLTYDYLSKTDDGYEWIRTRAQLFFWNSDNSLHMIAYQQNIDEEKRRELDLIEKSQKDALTGLYNKRATEELIIETLNSSGNHSFIIIDIDNFKSVNDNFSHVCGDSLLQELSAEIKANFHASDVSGRLGGDEFVVLMKNYGDVSVVKKKLEQLCERVRTKQSVDSAASNISFSMGVALFPEHASTYSELYEKADQALYYSKGHGKDTYTIYGEGFIGSTSYHVNQRDIDALINNSSDGIIKVACSPKPQLLYFNQKRMNLTGTPGEILTSSDYDPLSQVHPDDRERIQAELQAAYELNSTFTLYYNLKAEGDLYIPVRLKGFFTNEQYENQYPIFCGVYEIIN